MFTPETTYRKCFFYLVFRQLYLDIKKQIEEIDESKKEQVGAIFYFTVVTCYERCSHEITSMKRTDPFKITCAETVFNNAAERCSFLWVNVQWI